MNAKMKAISLFMFLLLCAPVWVSAAEESAANSSTDISAMDIINDTTLRDEVLANLESNGVNTSVLRAAISVGATGKVQNILEFYKDKLKANPNYVKPEETGNESTDKSNVDETVPAESVPLPTETKSPVSPFTILAGIGAAGCVIIFLKR